MIGSLINLRIVALAVVLFLVRLSRGQACGKEDGALVVASRVPQLAVSNRPSPLPRQTLADRASYR